MMERNERAERILRYRRNDRLRGEEDERRFLQSREGQEACPYDPDGHEWIEVTTVKDFETKFLCVRCNATASENCRNA